MSVRGLATLAGIPIGRLAGSATVPRLQPDRRPVRRPPGSAGIRIRGSRNRVISVVLCTYDRASTLRGTLESLRRLSVPAHLAWELVVVDNNSSDDTARVVAPSAWPASRRPRLSRRGARSGRVGPRSSAIPRCPASRGRAGLRAERRERRLLIVRLSHSAGSCIDGTFKIPGLRNVALTAPYFHNGGEATLLDVVDFYARGGSQGGATNPILTRDGTEIGGLAVLNFNTAPDSEAVKADLVAFLESLTDERVRIAAAPFDHPQIFVPNGHPGERTGHRLVPRDPGHRPERGSGPTGLSRGRLKRRAQPADACPF
jgi:Glycosyl transferase family 2